VSADRARAALSKFFSWAMGEGLADANPVIGTNKAAGDAGGRERVLTDAELVAVWNAAPDSAFGRIVKLLALTGQRCSEIGDLSRSEIDTAERLIALPGARTKNGRAHSVPLSDDAMAIVEASLAATDRELIFGVGKGGFGGWSKARGALDTASGVKDWTLHDLRRTWATRAADCGVQPHVIEACLNHVSGHKAGVAGVYNRAIYAVEKRQAMEAVANYIKTALAKASGANITRLQRA